jgi:uncharacterized protein
MLEREPSLQVVLKIASRCNLNCSYCYVYNKGDDSWRTRPVFMSEQIFDTALERIRTHCLRSLQRSVTITFHGGEPCLAGVENFDRWCRKARRGLADITKVRLCLQTNGTLLNDQWASLLKEHKVETAISLDGPKAINDAQRVDHQGRGSYDAIVRGLESLRRADVPIQILSVIQFGTDSLQIHRHFLKLGATAINYLFPDFTHDSIAIITRQYGPTPCADYLIPILDDWWAHGTMNVRVVLFWDIARLILGGESDTDLFGNRPFGFLFVETDGTIEGLDVLKICGQGLTRTPLNVMRDDFLSVANRSPLHRQAILTGIPLPDRCRGCVEETTCAGGYLPHRFSLDDGFNNPSVWCRDILKIFSHMRVKLEAPIEETLLRRQVLAEMAGERT